MRSSLVYDQPFLSARWLWPARASTPRPAQGFQNGAITTGLGSDQARYPRAHWEPAGKTSKAPGRCRTTRMASTLHSRAFGEADGKCSGTSRGPSPFAGACAETRVDRALRLLA